MSQPITSPDKRPPRVKQIEVTVTTSLSAQGPFREDYPPSALLSAVRIDAMEYFGIEPDPNYDYYLVHERQRVADTTTLDEVVDKKHEAGFRLAKEIKQG